MKFRRCPRTYVTESVEHWLRAYQMFKNGILPNTGGWLNQTNKFIEIMTFIEGRVFIFNNEMRVGNGRK